MLDRFDVVSLTCAAGLLVGVGFVSSTRADQNPEARPSSGSARTVVASLSRARAALDAGKPQKAIEQLNTFVTANPDVAEPHVLLAKAYASIKDDANAIREY